MTSGVTFPRGFRASGVASGVLTRNRVHAAPVRWTREVLLDGTARTVVLNSGGANACTGVRGEADTAHTAEYVANSVYSS